MEFIIIFFITIILSIVHTSSFSISHSLFKSHRTTLPAIENNRGIFQISTSLKPQESFQWTKDTISSSLEKTYSPSTITTEVIIEEINRYEDLIDACKFCVECFFDRGSNVWGNLKRHSIYIDLKNNLLERFNSKYYNDIYYGVKLADSNQLVGFAIVSLVEIEDECLKYFQISNLDKSKKIFLPKISNVCVDQNLRGQGIGFELIQQCIRKAMDLGYQQIFLDVEYDNNGAIRFYEKLNFRTLFSQNIQAYNMRTLFLEKTFKRSFVMRKLL